MRTEGKTIRRIRELVECGRLKEPFKPADVNEALGIDWAGVFLPKHRVGNPGQRGKRNSQLFVQIARATYLLNRL